MAAGDRNPHRAAGVMVPWLLGNIGFVRQAGTWAAMRALWLLRQGARDDTYLAFGPGLCYEVLAATETLAVFDLDGERLQCSTLKGAEVVGWPVGPVVWVFLAKRPQRDASCATVPPSLCGTDAASWEQAWKAMERLREPQAYIPLLFNGQQQLALLGGSGWCIWEDRKGPQLPTWVRSLSTSGPLRGPHATTPTTPTATAGVKATTMTGFKRCRWSTLAQLMAMAPLTMGTLRATPTMGGAPLTTPPTTTEMATTTPSTTTESGVPKRPPSCRLRLHPPSGVLP